MNDIQAEMSLLISL